MYARDGLNLILKLTLDKIFFICYIFSMGTTLLFPFCLLAFIIIRFILLYYCTTILITTLTNLYLLYYYINKRVRKFNLLLCLKYRRKENKRFKVGIRRQVNIINLIGTKLLTINTFKLNQRKEKIISCKHIFNNF